MKGYSQSSLGSVSVPPNLRQMYERVRALKLIKFFCIKSIFQVLTKTKGCHIRTTEKTSLQNFGRTMRQSESFRHGQMLVQSQTVFINFVLPRYGTKQTTWFHRQRTEHFLSQPTSLLHPTRLGESVRRCELFMNNTKNIMGMII